MDFDGKPDELGKAVAYLKENGIIVEGGHE